MRPRTLLGISLLLTFVAASSAFADRGMTACTMKYNLKGWSAFYKTASGSGMIRCDNGQKANVKISAKGGGLTAGKTDIRDGNGSFSKVSSINDLFGRYGSASAAAAARTRSIGVGRCSRRGGIAWRTARLRKARTR